MNEEGKILRMRSTVVMEYDVDSRFTGTEDPNEAARQQAIYVGGMFQQAFAGGNENITVQVEPVLNDEEEASDR